MNANNPASLELSTPVTATKNLQLFAATKIV
jgi:hypothetical protein